MQIVYNFLTWSAWKYLLARQCAFKIYVNFSEGFQFWNSFRFCYGNPADTRHWPKAGSMLVRRLRRRPNIEPRSLNQPWFNVSCLLGRCWYSLRAYGVTWGCRTTQARLMTSRPPVLPGESRRVQAWQFSPILTGDNWGKLFTIKGVREIDPSRSLTRTQRVGVGDKFLWKSPVVSGGEGSGVGFEAFRPTGKWKKWGWDGQAHTRQYRSPSPTPENTTRWNDDVLMLVQRRRR